MDQPADTAFHEALALRAAQTEEVLRWALRERARSDEVARPERLLAAMRHGVLNGGKRLRPFLLIETAAILGADAGQALVPAAALECVHCYSLIHDDLPAMDDDDLRRGQPTVHKAFDEATAILAGDALQTLAFELMAGHGEGDRALPAERRLHLVRGLAVAAGLGGMAGGQALDLEAERHKPDEAGIITLQAMKTGALIRFACEAGAIVAGASQADRERMTEFGQAIGLAFQLADDLLDMTGDSATVGKATGKDAAAGKATLPALHGADWARRQLDGLVAQAHDLLQPFGAAGELLRHASRFIADRRS